MNCEKIKPVLPSYLEHHCDVHTHNLVHIHLQACANCRAEMQKLDHLSLTISQLSPVVPPYSIVDSILPQIGYDHNGKAASKNPFRRFSKKRFMDSMAWRVAAGACVAGVAFVLVVIQMSPSASKEMKMSSDMAMLSDAPGSYNSTSRLASPEAIGKLSEETSTNSPSIDSHSTTSLSEDTHATKSPSAADQSNIESQDLPASAAPDNQTKETSNPNNTQTGKSSLQLFSLDEQIVAIIQNQQILIYTQDKQTLLYKSIYVWKPEDQIKLLAWSEQQVLTYEITHNGEQQTHQIDFMEYPDRVLEE